MSRARVGIRQKNGSPGHPQTQGKTERFHQTLQRWLAVRPTPRTLAELQQQLDQFRELYNERRPHRALQRRTPGQAYRATPKAVPSSNGHAPGHYRLRYDRLGIRFFLQPRRATLDFGVPADSIRGLTEIKGARDITSGVVPLVVWASAGTTTLGGVLVAAAIAPIADALIVLTNGGKLSKALGVHGVAAGLLVAAGLVLALG
jgi:hypothetical protein